jgi:uncharacterized protein
MASRVKVHGWRRRPLARLCGVVLVGLIPQGALAQDAAADGPAAPRVALVIGNSAYVNVEALPNPSNDARLVAEKLWLAGFEVIESIDSDRATMLADIATFQSRLREGSEALFYYAGHGVQLDGRNYLLPVSVAPASVDELKAQSIDAQFVVDIMSGSGAKLNLVLLDACRNNPFATLSAENSAQIASRSIALGQTEDQVSRGLTILSGVASEGLAEMSAGSVETMISFATAPGSVALDGAGRHSPYTEALAKNIDQPGMEIGDLFRAVRAYVREATGGSQITWTTSTLESRFYFSPTGGDPRQTTAGMAVAGDTLGILPPERVVDRAFWRAIRDSGKAEAFAAYLRTMPDGAFRADAEAGLKAAGGDPATLVKDDPLLPVLDAARSTDEQAEARQDALDSLDGPALDVTIGTSAQPLDLQGGGGWFWVSDPAHLGDVSGAAGTVLAGGAVQWLPPGAGLAYLPKVGVNGGVDTLKGALLGEGGTATPIEAQFETVVDACDLLAGNPYDGARVTAGTRQFIIDRNFDAAIAVCEIAVQNYPDVPRFWAQLARSYRAAGRYEDALVWQQKAVDAGYVNAAVYLGQMYLDGQAVPQDYAKAKALFEGAAEKGDTAAFTALAWIYRAGVGVPQDYARALDYYRQGAALGNDWAMTNIAEFYKEGFGVTADPAEAVRWYTAAAKSGELTAQTRLARMYQVGDGVEKDFTLARFWFETAASRGVPNALTRLGLMYEEGQGNDKDLEAAVGLYTRAAREGDMEARFRLGKVYASKAPLYDDPARAAGLLTAAAEAEVFGANRELGKLYEQGRGVEKDLARARALFVTEAEKNPWAARDAARAYVSDDGAAPDLTEAVRLYQIAVAGKVPPAALELGRLVAAGKGIEKDPDAALILFARALGLAGSDQKLADAAREAAAKASGEDITRAVQKLLADQGFFTGTVDGQPGPATTAALAAAFAAQGLAAPTGDAPTLDDLAILAAI